MQKIYSGILVLSLLGLSGACGKSTSSVSPEAQKFSNLTTDAKQGRAKFSTACIACHGPEGKGITGLGKDLTKSEFVKNLSTPELALFISKGRDITDPANTTHIAMPPRGGNPSLTDQDLVDIAAYIHTLQH